ncbi:MAG: DUF4097 family beta strand repeat protein [Verrucomicrobia bacterium]|nr:DUF4097 family beta strand repeat protein [Verrucomicrobiota bacterium]
MKSFRLFSSGLAAALLWCSAARAEDTTASIKFSDPAKPGTLKVALMRGDLRIKAVDTAEIAVTSETKPQKQVRKDGLRVISQSSSYALTEKDNVITLDARSDGWGKGTPTDFRVTVPRATNIIVESSFGGDIACTGLSGDLEIKSMQGEIRLDDVAGGVVVTTTNGEIRANIRELKDGKPLSFTSFNGEVVVRVAPEAKANVRLRTQNGSVLTDFDEKSLVTKTESSPRTSRRPAKTVTVGGSHPEIQQVVREAVRVSVEAAREVAVAAKEAAEAARAGAAEARGETPPTPPVPPMPKMPPIPPMTGGQLVTGTLNGGGTEISVATMNGDVTLRKLESQ